MDKKELFEIAIAKGYVYCMDSGLVTSPKGTVYKLNKGERYIGFCLSHQAKKYRIMIHQYGFYYVHKIIPPMVDHRNRIKIDNRIDNLRESNSQLNQWNRKNCKGVTVRGKRKLKYEASIKVNYKSIYLGAYDTYELAEAAYLEAKKKYHPIDYHLPMN